MKAAQTDDTSQRVRVASPGLPPFEQVVDHHGLDLWRFSVSQVGIERADDLFQATMLAALAAYPSLRDPTAVRSWLLRIAARKAIDLFRQKPRTPIPLADPDPGPTAEADPADDDLWARVRDLPAKQRQAVGLRFVADLDYGAIATVMDTSVPAARRNVFEALTTLRRQYDGGPCDQRGATP